MELGPYTLVDRIGAGASGIVWRARHRPTGRLVAVKLVHAGVDPRSLGREVRAMAALDHPNVLVVHDQGTVDRDEGPLVRGSPFVVTELAEGDLASLRPRDPAAVDRALADVLDGLAHAHARGVIHRDLKPENVLFAGGRWKLADFGLAWRTDAPDGPRRAGSPAYMAPEQLRGQVDAIGPSTDLYALGCVAWELATGAPPFDRPTLEEVVAAQLRDVPLPPAHLPPARAAWLRALLAKAPEDRPAFAADVRHALRRIGPATVAPTLSRPRSSAATIDLDAIDDVPLASPSPAEVLGPVPFDAEGWRPASLDEPIPRHGAELGLFGLRTLRLVGRAAEQERAWVALGAVHADRAARALWVSGPSGIGRTRFLAWLGETAHERGAAHVLWRTRERHDPLPEPFELERRDRPTVLLLDDADADPEGGQLLRRVLAARGAERVAALVVAATGPGADPAFLDELERLVPPEDRLPLGPVAVSHAEDIVRQLLRAEDTAVMELAGRSEGHPGWLVAEIERQVHGNVPRPDPRLAAALEGHGEAGRTVLELIAAAGGPIGLEVVGRVLAPLGIADPDGPIAAARAAGVVRGTDPIDVASPALRAALEASSVAAGRWADLHRRLAASAGDPIAVGRHLLLAGDPGEAIEPLWEAASHIAAADHAEAARLFARALDAAGEPLASHRSRMSRLYQAAALYSRGNHRLARRRFVEARSSPGIDDDPVWSAGVDALIAQCDIMRGYVDQGVLALDLSAARVQFRFAWTTVLVYGRDRARARREIERWIAEGTPDAVHRHRLVRLAEFDGDLDGAEQRLASLTGSWVEDLKAWYGLARGRFDDALRLGRAAAEHHRRGGNLQGLHNALLLQGEALSGQGDLAGALEGFAACRTLALALDLCPVESLLGRARALLRAGRREELGDIAVAVAPWSGEDARSDARAEVLALGVVVAAPGPAREAAVLRLEDDRARGGARPFHVPLLLELAAATEPSRPEADTLRTLALRFRA